MKEWPLQLRCDFRPKHTIEDRSRASNVRNKPKLVESYAETGRKDAVSKRPIKYLD